ncbi:phage major capsid protein [Arthrobacter sp. ISL-72]|uniref:phage major capsid protein n=1 Tax=Arthrobacter sp. ISL-72 TaxID=2819114 RepID=UPI001BEC5F3C|nr:phage major capsid protein [Arthrobacter sp. ISL-72]MBT2594738.1 phage major capsid protein [Arthrobacter sp. ISL-72]
MSETLAKKLLEKRAAAHEKGKAIIDAADAEGRALTAEESQSFDAITAEMDSLRSQADRLVAFENEQRDIAASLGKVPGRGEDRNEDAAEVLLRKMLQGRNGAWEYTPTHEERQEVRALVKGTPSAGGYTVPTTFYGQLMEHAIETSAILSAGATILYTSSGEEISVPVTISAPTGAQVGEGQTIPTSEPVLAKRSLYAYKYGDLSQLSRELADDSAFDLEGFIARQAGRAIGNAFGAKLVAGTGTNEPSGLITSTTLGKTGATAVGGAPTWDDLIDLFYSVIGPYRNSPNAGWLIKDGTAATLRKLKDSSGRYLWEPSIIAGQPDMIEGKPVFTDPNMPGVGLGNKSVAFGDMSAYFARIVNGVRFERSDDFAFDKDLITYRAIIRGDGVLVDQTGAVKHFAGGAS